MNDRYDIDDELEKSIAQIVDEEVSDARTAYNNLQRKSSLVKTINVKATRIEEVEEEPPINPKKKLAIIIGSITAVVLLIVGVAVYFINSTIKKKENSYGYYQNLAYEQKDNTKDYEKAVEYFEKAFSYKDKLLAQKTVKIGEKEVLAKEILVKDMLNARDCYAKLNRLDVTLPMLKEILAYDDVNENAVFYLIEYYETNKQYQEILNLYNSISVKENVTEKTLNFFKKFQCDVPDILPAEGEYKKAISLSFKVDDKCKVYYTLDGSDPKTSGSIYTDKVKLSEGNYNVKYYMVNEYGFTSDVNEAEYKVKFVAPEAVRITPESGAYTTSSEQMIIIGNIPSDAKAYYEISFTGSAIKPTKDSKEYTEPIEMPEGSFILSVVLIDENGLTSEVVTNTYTLKKVDKYSDAAAEQLIWSALVYNNVIDDKHMTADEELFEMSYNSKKVIDDVPYWIYSVKIAGEKQEYFYGCNADEGNIYKMTPVEGSDKFTMSELKYSV